MRKLFVPLAVIAVLCSGCGPDSEFARARKLESKGRSYKAWQKYQEFAAGHPQHARAPEALFRAGWLAQRELGDCTMAEAFYDGVVQRYPQSEPWANMAAFQKDQCPDYFPLIPSGEWVEGDSETKGKNARIETVCKPLSSEKNALPSQAGLLERTYYAGDKKFKSVEIGYKKNNSQLMEFSDPSDPRGKVVLKWPLEVGTRWSTLYAGRIFHYEVAEIGKKVTVSAGAFDDCVRVRSNVEGAPGSTNEYYAPGVGRVLTTISTSEGEKPNTELMSFKRAAMPELVKENAK